MPSTRHQLRIWDTVSHKWNYGPVDTTTEKRPIAQWTGLYDIHGKKIWEFDIIKDANGARTRPVVWNEETTGFNVRKTHIAEGQPRTSTIVVGNLFSNPLK